MRTFLFLTIALLAGCHDVCGSRAPFWVVADCAATDTGDTGDTGDTALVECDVMITVTIDGIESREGVDLSADEFWAQITDGRVPEVSTSQPSPGAFGPCTRSE